MTAQEVNGDVVFSYSGSLTLVGPGAPNSVQGGIQPALSLIVFGPGTGNSSIRSYPYVSSNPPNFGVGTQTRPTSFTGSPFSVRPATLMVPINYESGSFFSGSMTFAGETFQSLGINPSGAPYTWEVVSDQTITLTFLTADNRVLKAKLKKEIKKFTTKLKKAKSSGQKARIKAFKKKLNAAKKELRTLS